MNPSNGETEPYRVRLKGRNHGVLGWADPKTLREVHGIVIRDRPIRMEIRVRWDIKYPEGFINVKEIERIRVY